MIQRLWLLTLCLAACSGAVSAGEKYMLIENCSRQLSLSGNSSPGSASFLETEAPCSGLAAARLDYQLDANGNAALRFDDRYLEIMRSGTFRFWIRGDGQGHQLTVQLTHAELYRDESGSTWMHRHQRFDAARMTLDFNDWRELSAEVDIPQDRHLFLSELRLRGPAGAAGTLYLDELRVYPKSGTAAPSGLLVLEGPSMRPFSEEVNLLLDVRHFNEEPASVQVKVSMVDNRGNVAAERTFGNLLFSGNGAIQETRLALKPENLHLFIPPFRITAEALSNDLPDLSARATITLVSGNSYLLFEDFGNLFGRWFTSGMPFNYGGNNNIFGEAQRAWAETQTSARISRVDVQPGQDAPPGRHAMQIDFSGQTMIYAGEHRFLPGDAYAMGIWLHGDGSNADVRAIILDFAGAGSTFYTWNRHFGGRHICKLDFEGWRYFEIPLPGGGVGPRTLRGASRAIDFPLDLSAIVVEPQKDSPAGSVKIGPIHLHTQQTRDEALSVQIAYDDVDNDYRPDAGAWVTVQNGWRLASRSINASWALLDRYDEPIARGRERLELDAMGQKSFRVDLAPHAAKIAACLGPLRLQATAVDTREAASMVEQIILSKPDCIALAADFEAERGFFGLDALGVSNRPDGRTVARTSDQQKKSGKRSLAMEWRKDQSLFVSVDPPLAGIPTLLTLWLHGDGSGVLFYPLIGDQYGVVSGVGCNWDLFLPRTESGPLQNAVKVDWTGWRELTFRLPPIPNDWKVPDQVVAWLPDYPLGVHLAIQAPGGLEQESGTIYVDDIRVRTHLKPEERLSMRLERASEANVLEPGASIQATISNYDVPGPAGARKVSVAGGIFDWRAQPVQRIDQTLDVQPGTQKTLTLAKDVRGGAYQLQVELREGDTLIGTITEDLIVAKINEVLGAEWHNALRDTSKLRAPLRDRFAFVRHDWDWTEFMPGNFQPDVLLHTAAQVKAGGQDPWMLLGYSAYWAAGEGMADMLADRTSTRWAQGPGGRDWGHAPDIFMVPERMDDWENYVYNMMRLTGRHLAGFLLWNTPDSNSMLGLPPAKFAEMIRLTDKWRRRYCPDTPLVLGGLSRATALPYLGELIEQGALEHFTGVNLRLDVGKTSPEDGHLAEFIQEMQAAMNVNGQNKTVLLTDLDWAVEREGRGLDAFDQAAYLSRAVLLLDRLGVEPTLILQNDDSLRLGFGLIYRKKLTVPPMSQVLPTFQLKPGWWAMTRVKDFLARMEVGSEISVQDVVPGHTRCLLYERKGDRRPAAVVWRNNRPCEISFELTGLSIESAEDIFGSAVPVEAGWYSIGKAPVIFTLKASDKPAGQGLALLRVRENSEDLRWPQDVLAVFSPDTGKAWNYTQTGGASTVFDGRTTQGRSDRQQGVSFPDGGSESFQVTAPADSGLVIRKRFFLGEAGLAHGNGHAAEVIVNGKQQGTMDVKRTDKSLSGGLREAIYVVGKEALGAGKATIELRYAEEANTCSWSVFAWRGGSFPLSAVGAIHADSTVASPRIARNVVGMNLRISGVSYDNGIGVFAPCLLEYALNGQFSKFTADAGIDAATEGGGSVVFEIYGDGEKLWSSGLVTGLDKAKPVDVNVEGVRRLQLTVTDGGDGNRLDAADWADATLHR